MQNVPGHPGYLDMQIALLEIYTQHPSPLCRQERTSCSLTVWTLSLSHTGLDCLDLGLMWGPKKKNLKSHSCSSLIWPLWWLSFLASLPPFIFAAIFWQDGISGRRRETCLREETKGMKSSLSTTSPIQPILCKCLLHRKMQGNWTPNYLQSGTVLQVFMDSAVGIQEEDCKIPNFLCFWGGVPLQKFPLPYWFIFKLSRNGCCCPFLNHMFCTLFWIC